MLIYSPLTLTLTLELESIMRLYHSTGRTYNGEQELVIDVLSITPDEIDGFFFIKANFSDASRSIRGTVDNVVHVNTDFPSDAAICEMVQSCYDDMQYQDI